jgi:uncharacterized cofD-like protein
MVSSGKSRPPKEALRPLRVVAIGGGTGLSTLLKGLKKYVNHAPTADEPSRNGSAPSIDMLTAVVTVTDDGGSSGRLRNEFGILPPGDIRNCIVALAEDDALMSRLFRYRFPEKSALEGHSFGNLFLCALTDMTGDFAEAVRLSSDVLTTRGHIYPATKANCELEALMDDGSRVRGETKITASKRRIVKLEMIPGDVQPLPQTLDAIANADLITIGPGSLFTSLIPNVLVHGIPEAIAESSALKIYVCNLMSQANESLGLTASEHIKAIYDHAHARVFDAALLNTKSISSELKAKYALEGASQIVIDEEAIQKLGVKTITGEFLYEDRGVARHAYHRVAEELMRIATSGSLAALSV